MAIVLGSCSAKTDRRAAEEQPQPSYRNVAIISEPNYPTPDSFANGRFEVSGDCLLFISVNGGRFNPILPFGSRIVRGSAGEISVSLLGRTVPLGELVALKGGSGEYGRAGPVDPACAAKNMVIGGMRDQDI